MAKPAKKRLDLLIVERGLAESREKAQAMILAGEVRVNGQKSEKAGTHIADDARVEVVGTSTKYASRGGLKLEGALEDFGVAVEGKVCLDIGASTGGFTDCLLQHGAAQVYAVDVGQGQLAWKLRQDPRVVVMEKINARHLNVGQFPQPFVAPDLAVIDCSFISLRTILPPAIALLQPSSKIVALIKPQFEAGKAEADKGEGVISDPVVHQRVLRELEEFVATQPGVTWRDVTESPLRGPAGNKEFLVLIEKVR